MSEVNMGSRKAPSKSYMSRANTTLAQNRALKAFRRNGRLPSQMEGFIENRVSENHKIRAEIAYNAYTKAVLTVSENESETSKSSTEENSGGDLKEK